MKLLLLKAAVATALCVSLIGPQSTRAGTAQLHSKLPLAMHSPARISVKEPVRVRAPLPAMSATMPKLSQGVRPRDGRRVAAPPMLRSLEIDSVLKAAAALRKRAPATRTGIPTVEITRRPGRGVIAARPAPRGAQSLPSDPGASGTGVNAWWPYHVESIPGGGHAMVNVGTGNLLLQDDDMSVPHKGVPMAFRRTYNSQGAASTGTGRQSLYGNGWTSTFDAHISGSNSGPITVYDVDGASYTYSPIDGTNWAPPSGQHASLSFDGGCGFLWTKTSGTTYYFWVPGAPPPGNCPSSWYPSYGAYTGRLYQIIGRNRNSKITFNYSWDFGNASPGVGKISAIAAQTESGMTATLNFADLNGRRLLQQLVYPDGVTTVQYGYDANGNLATVSRPPNNVSGVRPVFYYGYQTVGSDTEIQYVASPRWCGGSSTGCGYDGGYLWFAFSGTAPANSTLNTVYHGGVVNPTILDGTNSPLHPGYVPEIYNSSNFLIEYYTTGVSTPTLRDTDGRMVNWVVDGAGRPTQTQQCTESVSQGQRCTGSWLVQNESWDANNNLVGIVDPRGGTRTMFYDSGGNVVAIEQPPPYQGWNPPTTLIDYDSFGNVTAVCDPAVVYNSWTGQYNAGADNYCSSQFGTANHWNAQYAYPSYQPYGERISVTSPSGYVRTTSYDPAAQGGLDYGLPTGSSGISIVQFDQSTRQPSESAKYDNNGNVICASRDAGTGTASSIATIVLTYDALSRLTAAADADDSSLPGSCGKAPGIGGSNIVTRSTYYADGSVATTQTPSEAARNSGTVYSYDLDGGQVSEAPYTGTPQSVQTPRKKSWFDGADRLVETQEPADPATPGDIPISLRYRYDLTKNGVASTLSGASVIAHGNLFDTVKNTPSGWIDFTYAAFDAADRPIASYAFAPCPFQPGQTGAIYCNQPAFRTRYDWDSSSLNPGAPAPGLIVSTLDGVGVARLVTYDPRDYLATINYSGGDNGITSQVLNEYDYDGRLTRAGDVNFSYNADGTVRQKASHGTAVSYSYYPDSMLAGVAATATSNWAGSPGDIVNQPNLYQYAYRNDGLLAAELFGVSNQSISLAYTRAGRPTTLTDFGSSPSMISQYADGYGRLSSYQTPSGTYGAIVYDAQGRITQYTDPYASIDGETVASTFNIRGDLVGRTFSGGWANAKPGFAYKNIQGVLVQNAGDQYDGRTGAPVWIYGAGAFQYDSVGRLVNAGGALGYDAESRLVSGDTWNASSAADSDCHSGGALAPGLPPPSSSRELTYQYDGVGQLFQDKTQGGSTRQWAWSGADMLFTAPVTLSYNGTPGMGAPFGYGADGLGSITSDGSSPGLTIADHDFDGGVVQYHNSTGHSAWAATNTYNRFCQHASPLPASSNYNVPAKSAFPGDGTSAPGLSVSSTGRAYLSQSMGFTTPDYSSVTPYSHGRHIRQWDPNGRVPSRYDHPPTNPPPSSWSWDWIDNLTAQAQSAWNDLMAYNLAEGAQGKQFEDRLFPHPANSALVKLGAKIHDSACLSSAGINAGYGYKAFGGAVTYSGNVLGSGGVTKGIGWPPLAVSVVFTFGKENAPEFDHLSAQAGAFAGPGFDFDIGKAQPADVGFGTPQAGVGDYYTGFVGNFGSPPGMCK